MNYKSKIMYNLIILSLFLPLNLTSGSIDSSMLQVYNYPDMQYYFRLFDDDGNELRRIKMDDFSLEINGESSTITDFHAPESISKYSYLLLIDRSLASGYQDFPGDENYTKSEAFINVVRQFIDSLKINRTECAITVFSHFSEIRAGFTTDKDSLRSCLDSIPFAGGIDLNSAFLGDRWGDPAPADLMDSAKYQPAVIMLLGGNHELNHSGIPEIGEIIGKFVKNYSLFYSLCAFEPDSLTRATLDYIADEAGNNSRNIYGISDYNSLRYEFNEIILDNWYYGYADPLMVQWDGDCSSDNGKLVYSGKTQAASSFIIDVPHWIQPALKIAPELFTFENYESGQNYDTTITIEARFSPVRIESLDIDNDQFSAPGLEDDLPLELDVGDTYSFEIIFTPDGVHNTDATFDFIGNLCTGFTFYHSSILEAKENELADISFYLRNESLYINKNQETGIILRQIYDMNGKSMITSNDIIDSGNIICVDISRLGNSVYFAMVSRGQYVYYIKFIK